MASFGEIERVVQRLKSGELPLPEIVSLLQYRSPIVRANAWEAIAAQGSGNDSILNDVMAEATDPANKGPLMGTISVAHVAVACLLRIGTPPVTQAVQTLLETWPEPDRTDLTWYLKSEGLMKSG